MCSDNRLDINTCEIRLESFARQGLLSAEACRAGQGVPHSAGSLVLRQGRRESWLSVIDWGDWIKVTGAGVSVTISPHQTFSLETLPESLRMPALQQWLGQLRNDFLSRHAEVRGTPMEEHLAWVA